MSMKYVTLAILAAGVSRLRQQLAPAAAAPDGHGAGAGDAGCQHPRPCPHVRHGWPATVGRSEATGTLARGCRAPGPVSVQRAPQQQLVHRPWDARPDQPGRHHRVRGLAAPRCRATCQGGTMTLTTTGRCGYTRQRHQGLTLHAA